ncbi:hypothetical protein GGQ68_002103 [Sagittula marina]|uniref:Uncharacterized protein n=1 Tax=Sagittula marina TaxID=943940 RepID=A0A7W6DSB6_9RHOB|nr:hypothetical protein [Sagittula marina]
MQVPSGIVLQQMTGVVKGGLQLSGLGLVSAELQYCVTLEK